MLGGAWQHPRADDGRLQPRGCPAPAPPVHYQDPSFDSLLSAIFGDVRLMERQLLDPPTDVVERAKSIGQHIAAVRCSNGWRAAASNGWQAAASQVINDRF